MSTDIPPAQILKEAASLILDDRADTHGDMIENHRNIAQLWQGYLHDKMHHAGRITAHDAANMMELLKVARRKTGAHNDDDYIDAAGYAAVAHECSK
tara:strand:+ start:1601 stop:1891 length:291 start_codon:yes stop_codon:yes gene_type:complete